MLYENLPLPLPWYKKVTLQDRFRQNVNVDAVITQLAPSDGLLPFQFRKEFESLLPETWKVKCATPGKTVQDYLDGFTDADVLDISDFIIPALEGGSFDGYDYITFKNESNSLNILADLADGLPPGVYYLEVDFGEGFDVWCSETFRVPDDPFSWDVPSEDCNYICLKWSHDTDIRPIHYDAEEATPFYNLLYLPTFITGSEPEIIIDGENDGLQEFHPTFHKVVVRYRISAMVPDYIKIALYALSLHENKYLFTEKALREGEIKNYEISHTLDTDGAHSIIEILCEQISLLTKTNCTDNMLEPDEVGISFTPPTLAVDYCEASGDVSITMTGGSIPLGLYGELQGSATLGGTYTAVFPYISRADMLAGWSGNIGAGLGLGYFKIAFRTFTYYDGAESGPVAATPSC